MPQTIESISDFLVRYKNFYKEKMNLRFDEFVLRFNHIKISIESINSISHELNRHYAKNFNIFNLLGVDRKEDKTHTAFIANLLDPEGSHAQGDLFLDLFLKYCNTKDSGFPKLPSTISNYKWYIEPWKFTIYGIPDLVVSSPDLEFLFVIENKIDAKESEDQLRRYSDWMKSRKNLYKNQSLIFLNPIGYPSKTAGNNKYLIMSYEDVFNWLYSSLRNIKAPRIKEIIIQYLETIEKWYS